MNEHNNELRHYGVLGMRWGVRRTRDQLARAAKQRSNENFEAAKTLKDNEGFLDDEETRKQLVDGCIAAGKRFLKAHQDLMDMDVDRVSERMVKKIYWDAVRDAEIMNYGLDVFDLRDRGGR